MTDRDAMDELELIDVANNMDIAAHAMRSTVHKLVAMDMVQMANDMNTMRAHIEHCEGQVHGLLEKKYNIIYKRQAGGG